jgi:hypothetical protein
MKLEINKSIEGIEKCSKFEDEKLSREKKKESQNI